MTVEKEFILQLVPESCPNLAKVSWCELFLPWEELAVPELPKFTLTYEVLGTELKLHQVVPQFNKIQSAFYYKRNLLFKKMEKCNESTERGIKACIRISSLKMKSSRSIWMKRTGGSDSDEEPKVWDFVL